LAQRNRIAVLTDSLIEMAQWYKGHAFAARMILGWAAGLEDTQLHQLVDEDPPNTLLKTFKQTQ
jgi:hypothetical protein